MISPVDFDFSLSADRENCPFRNQVLRRSLHEEVLDRIERAGSDPDFDLFEELRTIIAAYETRADRLFALYRS
jgi:hypothetical protein